MFTRLFALMQMRRSTAFLLARQDDRLLDDIGLSRGDLDAMHMGLRPDVLGVIPAARSYGTRSPA